MEERGNGHKPDTGHAMRPVRIGDGIIELPIGVSVGEWLRYKSVEQNPRLRAYLGCITMLEDVLDSNYAILHSSPERFLDIRRKVQSVSELIRAELAPLLETPSPIPSLETTRLAAREGLALLTRDSLRELDEHTEQSPAETGRKERKLLCVCIGQIHNYLQDTFGDFMAADPRSRHDADYFLSRRFQREVEESEWLYTSVFKFHEYLKSLGQAGPSRLSMLMATMERDRMLPVGRVWKESADFVREVSEVLTPKIRQLLTLRGIRFPEMETLSRYADELPVTCSLLIATYEAGRNVVELVKRSGGRSEIERHQRVLDLVACHESNCRRLIRLTAKLLGACDDLRFFVPIWLESLERRRALMLRLVSESRQGGEEGVAEPEAPVDAALEQPLGNPRFRRRPVVAPAPGHWGFERSFGRSR